MEASTSLSQHGRGFPRVRSILLAPIITFILWVGLSAPVTELIGQPSGIHILGDNWSLVTVARAQSTITVDSTLASVELDGRCTLNEAIINANDNAATHRDCKKGSGADTIAFDIQGPGPHTIVLQPGRELNITDSVLIDGLSQPAYGGQSTACRARRTLLIELDGSASGKTTGLIVFNTEKVVIRGLAINSFAGAGIHVVNSRDVLIQCNHIGTNPGGNIAKPNANAGIQLSSNSERVTIGTNSDGIHDDHEYNVISGNGKTGILVNRSHDNIIAGNRIGVDFTGIFALGNGGIGIQVFNRSRSNRIGTDSDGFADIAEQNTIASNGNHGISVYDAGTNDTVIAGNMVGTNIFGSRPLGNGTAGINVTQGAARTRIGGPAETDRNIISGNESRGIWVQTASRTFAAGRATHETTIQGNLIGVDITGRKMPNMNQGILLQLAASTLIIDNIISNNLRRGIYVKGGEAIINNNAIHKNGQSAIELTFHPGRSISAEEEAVAPDDVVSSVSINGNSIVNNCRSSLLCAGIMGIDVSVDPNDPTKGQTLALVNDIQENNGFPDVAQYWYGAVELLDENVPVSFNLEVDTSNNGPTYSLVNSLVAGDGLNNIIMRGPSGFNTEDIYTWSLLLDYIIDENGQPTNYTLRTAGGGVHAFENEVAPGRKLRSGYRGDGIVTNTPALFSTANDSHSSLRYRIFQFDIPVVTLNTDQFAINGQTAAITATLNRPITKDVAVILSFDRNGIPQGRSAAVEQKRSEVLIPKLLIPAGEQMATIKIPVTKELIDEGEERIQLFVSSIRNAYSSRRPIKIAITE